MTVGRVWVAGHFGELMQGRLGPDGTLALVTLPCPDLAVEAWHFPGSGLTVHGVGQRLLSPRRARRFMDDLGRVLSGRVVLRAGMPAGGGAGASTAALVALARLSGPGLDAADLARACLAAEGASDPLMFPAPERLLWASRQARVVERLPPLPAFDVVGGFFGPPRRTDGRDLNFPDISDLVGPWRSALQRACLDTLGALAAISARRTLSLRGPSADPTEALAVETGAKGFAIAHTGSARALLFAPGEAPPGLRLRLRAAGFHGVLAFRVGS